MFRTTCPITIEQGLHKSYTNKKCVTSLLLLFCVHVWYWGWSSEPCAKQVLLSLSHTSSPLCQSGRKALERVKDAACFLLQSSISPVQLLKTQAIIRNEWLFPFPFAHARSEEKAPCPLGDNAGLGCSWTVLNQGCKYSSRSWHRITRKAERGWGKVGPIPT